MQRPVTPPRAVGVFDSGLGGLTVVKQLLRLAPRENIIYFGDTARVPYGNRSPEAITRYAGQAIAFLLSFDVKFLIDACGTMSSILYPQFTDRLPVCYIDVIDASAKAAVAATKNGRVGVIATAATVATQSFCNAINRFAPGVSTFSAACPLFVPLVENGYIEKDNEVTRLVAEKYLAGMKNSGVDTLILGCTHYPLIAELIADVMGDGVTLVDSGLETAKEALNRLEPNDSDEKGRLELFTSDCPLGFTEIAELFLERELENVSQIDIDSVLPFTIS
ncbi:MAG: glutamate racemase [Oscillospiraceae bacterium]|nr:glutamate racemase [Oscillospiraceae bacterium]